MFMYLPFLLALLATVGIALGWQALGHVMWLLTLGVTLYWFAQHATGVLSLSF